MAVAGAVAAEFGEPEGAVGGGECAVEGTGVPEAAVDEEGEFVFGEVEVGVAEEGVVAAPTVVAAFGLKLIFALSSTWGLFVKEQRAANERSICTSEHDFGCSNAMIGSPILRQVEQLILRLF